MVGNYKVVTLCGSTRFKEQYLEVQKKLTLEGCIVLSVGVFGHGGDAEVWENMDEGTLTRTKEMLDDMHKRKIDMADEIFVINVGGYIGDSTRSEIAYAKAAGKGISYLEEPEKEKEKNEIGKPVWMVLMTSVFLYGSVQIVIDLEETKTMVRCKVQADGSNEWKEKEFAQTKESFVSLVESVTGWFEENRELFEETEHPCEYRVKGERANGLQSWVAAIGDSMDNRILFAEGSKIQDPVVQNLFALVQAVYPETERFLKF